MPASLSSFAVPTHTLGRDQAAGKASDLVFLEWQQQRAARLGLRTTMLADALVCSTLLRGFRQCMPSLRSSLIVLEPHDVKYARSFNW